MAIRYHKLELQTCESEDSVEGYALASRFLGDCYRDKDDIKTSKKYYHQALAMIRQDCQHVSDVYEEHACSPTGILWLYLSSSNCYGKVISFILSKDVGVNGILSFLM